MPKQQLNKYDKKHLANLKAYERQIDRIFQSAVREAAKISGIVSDFNPDKQFSFKDYPATSKRVEKLLTWLKNDIESVVLKGIDHEWTLSNNKNNELSNRVFGDNVGKLTEQQYRRYYRNNEEARDAFKTRQEEGLSLSDRVWEYTNIFKSEIEQGIDLGLRDGISADELSRDLRSYLKNPDKLFRRVRDIHGNLVLSQAAQAFHPGRGVYRSSYKNARRLAATEINMAYRTADYLRWQQLDFVVGIKICLSNNHTLNGQPFNDICDELAGDYPKDFKFTGWHPQCRCHAVSILKTEEELMEENKAILEGKEPSTDSVNAVRDVPKNFKDWLTLNEDRAKRSTSVPYFIRDNTKYLPKGYKGLYALKTPYETYAEYEAAMRYNKKHANFTPDIAKNNRELDKVLPVMQGKIMNFTKADGGKANPNYTIPNAEAKGYYHNCQTCTMAYELRRRGFRVEAMPNPVIKGYKEYREFDKFCAINDIEWNERFLTNDGKRAKYTVSTGIKDTGLAKLKFIEDNTSEHGRYEVYCAWKTKGAHVFIVERQKDGNLLWFDPQSGRRGGALDFNNNYIEKMKANHIGIMRIDNKLINTKFAKKLLKAAT